MSLNAGSLVCNHSCAVDTPTSVETVRYLDTWCVIGVRTRFLPADETAGIICMRLSVLDSDTDILLGYNNISEPVLKARKTRTK